MDLDMSSRSEMERVTVLSEGKDETQLFDRGLLLNLFFIYPRSCSLSRSLSRRAKKSWRKWRIFHLLLIKHTTAVGCLDEYQIRVNHEK